jgi:hypothetical protein
MLTVQSGTAELRREIARRASSEIGQRQQDWESLGLAKGRIYIEGDNDLLVPGPRLNLAAQRFSEIVRGEH